MASDADRLLEIALKKVGMRDGFSPEELGAKVGLNKVAAQAAARTLANAGVLVIGFDQSAEFSDDFRRSKTGPTKTGSAAKAATKKRPTSKRALAAK
jgi:hypothetical protein